MLLNVNIAFLSIQSVDNGGLVVSHRSPAQILVYASTVTSLSSMLFALFLLKQNRPKGQRPAEMVVSVTQATCQLKMHTDMLMIDAGQLF